MSSANPINRILINGTQREEIRIALTSDKFLDDLFIQSIDQQPTAGNIYLAKVSRVVPSLQAAFVDYGAERHGFLPLKEIAPHYYKKPELYQSQEYVNISDVLNEGQVLLVQVEKEERGNKGAALTSFITLAGCYLVLMPNNADAGGISRRVEGEERDQLRDLLASLKYPQEMGLIIRTAGVGKAIEELQWDLDVLLKLWSVINHTEQQQTAPCLIHQESDIIIRALRDYLRKDIDEIIIDTPQLFEQARNHLAVVCPEIDIVKYYDDPAIPLFTRYHIENQIETAFQRDVRLPSGGYIVIQETEALVSIDVNSARDTKSGDIELTAFNTNKEAAIEVARQLRLRDLGGLIVIDFIDMNSSDNQQKIVDIFKNEIRHDKARVQYSRISRFGLLEVSRQRLRPSLKEGSQIVCPRCNGQGSIRSIESLALLILRLLRQEAMQTNVSEVHVQVPVDVATFLMNEKRSILAEIEHHQKVLLRILPNPHMETPQYKMDKVFDTQQSELGKASYQHLSEAEYTPPTTRIDQTSNIAEPVIKGIETPVKPIVKQTQKPGLFVRLLKALFGKAESDEETKRPHKGRHHRQRRHGGPNIKQRPAHVASHEHSSHPSAQKHVPKRGRPAQHQQTRAEAPSYEERKPKREPRQPQERRQARTPRNNRERKEEVKPTHPVAEVNTASTHVAPTMVPKETVPTVTSLIHDAAATMTEVRTPASTSKPTMPAAFEIKPGLYTSQPPAQGAFESTADTTVHDVQAFDTATQADSPEMTNQGQRTQRQGQRRQHSRNRYRRQHRVGNQQSREGEGNQESRTVTDDEKTSS